jgi:hypothetical protein
MKKSQNFRNQFPLDRLTSEKKSKEKREREKTEKEKNKTA